MDGHQRRREQSGRMIETALLELMREKEFVQITVSEIAKKADVGRRTFYRLYMGKEDVLHCHFDKLCQSYRDICPVLNKYDIDQIAGEYFGFWYQHKDFLLLMHRCGLDQMLYYEISRVSEDIVKNRIGSIEVRNSQEASLFADYSTGGFILLLHRWILNGMWETPESYAKNVSKAILKFVRPVMDE